MEDLTDGMRELRRPDANGLFAGIPMSWGMSNCGYEVDDGFEEAIRAEPGKVYGRHAGRNFNGHVWFDGEKFVEQPWVYGVPRQPISAPTLRELMAAVNEVYGSD